MQHNKIVGLSLLIIGIIIIAIFSIIIICKKNKNKNSFKTNNEESDGPWNFTKKNLPIFLALFGLILSVYGIVMICK